MNSLTAESRTLNLQHCDIKNIGDAETIGNIKHSEEAKRINNVKITDNAKNISSVKTAGLAGEVVKIKELTLKDKKRMLKLMENYFTGVTWEHFKEDIAEKEWAFILRNAANEIQGFSTLMILRTTIRNKKVAAFFSGDTIVEKQYWQENKLFSIWAHHVFTFRKMMPETTVYWFLISSGYKTYRILPVFFKEFYPNYLTPTPHSIKEVLDSFALQKFPHEYDIKSGIVKFSAPSPLKEGVAPLPESRTKNPHINFYGKINPGHILGDELACITEISKENLTPAGLKILGLGETTHANVI